MNYSGDAPGTCQQKTKQIKKIRKKFEIMKNNKECAGAVFY